MNKNFTIIDKINNIQKIATKIVKFTLDSKDYLIYSVEENEENRQIFVSRFILNTEGKYFIDNIAPEEKAKLSDIVYNIIILTPTNYKKGENVSMLLNNLVEKFKINLACDNSELGIQEYFNNCSIAITSKELVELATQFFEANLRVATQSSETVVSVPTWNIPTSGINEMPVEEKKIDANIVTPEIPKVVENMETAMQSNVAPVTPIPNMQINAVPNVEPMPNIEQAPMTAPLPSSIPTGQFQGNMPNPQLAIVSDPSLANTAGVNMQPNVMKLNNKGKANVKYIIIGTACIILAIAVVIVAYILIQKKTTGV